MAFARARRRLVGLSPLADVPPLPGRSRLAAHVFAIVVWALACWAVIAEIEDQLSGGAYEIGTVAWEMLLLFWLFGESTGMLIGAFMAHRALRHWQHDNRIQDLVLTPLTPIQIGHILLSRALRPMLRVLLFALVALEAWLLLWVGLRARLVLSDLAVLASGLLMIAFNTRLTLLLGAWSQVNLSLAWPGALRPLWAQLNHFAVQGMMLFMPLLVLVVSAVAVSEMTLSTSRIWSLCYLAGVLVAFLLHWAILAVAVRGWARCFERTTFPGVGW